MLTRVAVCSALVYVLLSLASAMQTTTILPHLTHLNSPKIQIILGSQSPRRKELLTSLGLKNFSVCPSTFEEDLSKDDFRTSAEYCMATAKGKVISSVL
jgi:hypothetical protein